MLCYYKLRMTKFSLLLLLLIRVNLTLWLHRNFKFNSLTKILTQQNQSIATDLFFMRHTQIYANLMWLNYQTRNRISNKLTCLVLISNWVKLHQPLTVAWIVYGPAKIMFKFIIDTWSLSVKREAIKTRNIMYNCTSSNFPLFIGDSINFCCQCF